MALGRNRKLSTRNPFSFPWFGLALLGLFLFSLVLRCWRLGAFNTLIFDEVYYPVFANRYLLGEPVYNAHPPLTQYLLAIALWLGSHVPFGQEITNGLLGSLRSPWSYRWLNALTGSLIPVVVGAIAYQLTQRRSYGAIAALFAALDGLFLVESRLALNNIYLVIFGLLGQLFFLLAINSRERATSAKFYRRKPPSWKKLAIAGLFFGASAAIKWNGLGFLLGTGGFWILAKIATWGQKKQLPSSPGVKTLFQRFSQVNLLQMIVCLGMIPIITYALSWTPHLLMNPHPGFWEMQSRILTFHQNVKSDAHRYCSPWYSWPIMQRPVAYFYQTTRTTEETVPSLPPLPRNAVQVIHDVHAMGNPILWWLSTLAIALLFLLLLQQLWLRLRRRSLPNAATGVALYLVLNYGANLLPWLSVKRCTFLYHYMASSVFATLAIAWMVDFGLRSKRYLFRKFAIAAILVTILAFFFWLPIYLGLPLSPQAYQLRMWFRTWI